MVGEADLVIAGGVEDMEKVPMMSGMQLFDSLWARYNPAEIPMGNTAEKVADIYDVSRADMENMAMYSHKKAYTNTALAPRWEMIQQLWVCVLMPNTGSPPCAAVLETVSAF